MSMKDYFIEQAVKVAKPFLQPMIQRYGELRDLQIDTTNRKIKLSILLSGEKEETSLSVTDFELERIGNKGTINIHRGESNKLWLTNILTDFVFNKSIEVPEQVFGWLEKLFPPRA